MCTIEMTALSWSGVKLLGRPASPAADDGGAAAAAAEEPSDDAGAAAGGGEPPAAAAPPSSDGGPSAAAAALASSLAAGDAGLPLGLTAVQLRAIVSIVQAMAPSPGAP